MTFLIVLQSALMCAIVWRLALHGWRDMGLTITLAAGCVGLYTSIRYHLRARSLPKK